MSCLVRRPATISATNALLWGIFWLLGGAIIGWHFSIIPTTIVGYAWGSATLIRQVVYALVIWLSLTLPSYLCALILNRESKLLEVSWRMLFAHLPITFLTLPIIVGDRVSYSIFTTEPFSAQLSPLYIVLMMLFCVAIVLWYIYWSYLAFSCAVKREGWSVFALFILSLASSYILSVKMFDWVVYII